MYVRYDSPQFQALFGSRSTKSVDFRQLPALAESQLEYGNDLLPNMKSNFLYSTPKGSRTKVHTGRAFFVDLVW